MAGIKKIEELTGRRTQLIDRLINALEKKVETNQGALLRLMVTDLVDSLDRDGDTIKNTIRNKRLVALVDNLYIRFSKTKGLETVKSIADGVGKITNFNSDYFGLFTEPGKLAKINSQVTDTMSAWLGIGARGGVEPNGYLDTIVKDPSVKNKIKDMIMGGVVSQKGFFDLKKGLGDYITGGGTNTGALNKYYRNFVYDTYSVADRTNAKIFADKLKFKYAIYEGGLIKTSREFCQDKNGKVFSREEIADFDPQEAKPPGYNPFTDLGGYGCRHHLNWVPDAIAFALRPELKNGPPPKVRDVTDPKPQPKATEKDAPERPAFKTPFGKLEKTDIITWKATSAAQTKAKTLHAGYYSKLRKAEEEKTALQKQSAQLSKKQVRETDTEALKELRTEITKVFTEFAKVQKEVETLEGKVQEQNNTFRQEMIKGLTRSNVKISMNSPTLAADSFFNNKLGIAVDFFRAAARGYMEDFSISVITHTGNRDNYWKGVVKVKKGTSIQVLVHELSHSLEEHNSVMKAAVDFLDRRTAGQPLRKLKEVNRAHKAHEVYKKGDFFSPYVGKFYNDRRANRYADRYATEVISMGMQRMFADPINFQREDPEHFNLIYTLFFKR